MSELQEVDKPTVLLWIIQETNPKMGLDTQRDLLGETAIQDKGRRGRSRLGEPETTYANLMSVKGVRERREKAQTVVDSEKASARPRGSPQAKTAH